MIQTDVCWPEKPKRVARFHFQSPTMNFKQRREQAILWAKQMHELDVLLVDTEYSGGSLYDEIIEIGVVDSRGEVLYESRFRPSVRLNKYAAQVHGITELELREEPNISSVWHELCEVLDDRHIIAYNYSSDRRMIQQTAKKYGLYMPKMTWQCLMKAYTSYSGRNRHTNLKQACLEMNVLSGDHSAVSDALAAARVLHRMTRGYKIREVQTNVVIT